MGLTRSLPENQVQTLSTTHQDFYSVTASACGWQYYMEDFSLSFTSSNISFFVVIDGHFGPEVAQLCKQKIPTLVEKIQQFKKEQVRPGLQILFHELEQLCFKSQKQINQIRAKYKLPPIEKPELTRSGCSIVLAAINEQKIIISNIGMSKCYGVYRKDKSKAILFSGNHTTLNKEEEARIIKNNGFIINGKVKGIYPHTRSIGDYHIKNSKRSASKIKSQDLLISNQASFFNLRKNDIDGILLGSSGFWQKNEKVGEIMSVMGRGQSEDKQKLEELISSMIGSKIQNEKERGLQNMTCVYVHFI